MKREMISIKPQVITPFGILIFNHFWYAVRTVSSKDLFYTGLKLGKARTTTLY